MGTKQTSSLSIQCIVCSLHIDFITNNSQDISTSTALLSSPSCSRATHSSANPSHSYWLHFRPGPRPTGWPQRRLVCAPRNSRPCGHHAPQPTKDRLIQHAEPPVHRPPLVSTALFAPTASRGHPSVQTQCARVSEPPSVAPVTGVGSACCYLQDVAAGVPVSAL